MTIIYTCLIYNLEESLDKLHQNIKVLCLLRLKKGRGISYKKGKTDVTRSIKVDENTRLHNYVSMFHVPSVQWYKDLLHDRHYEGCRYQKLQYKLLPSSWPDHWLLIHY